MSRQRTADFFELAIVRAMLIFAAAQVLDVGTTVLGRRLGMAEGNPLAMGLFARSMELSLSLKLLVGTLVMLTVLRFVSPQRRRQTLVIICTIALMAPLINSVQILLGA
jgi:hypothetical protein